MISWYDELYDVQIVYVALPSGCDGFLSPRPDGGYTILISTDISEERQRAVYEHELDHILNDDLYKASADEAEARCHSVQKIAKQLRHDNETERQQAEAV